MSILRLNEHEELVKSRDVALAALHGYADELEKRLPKMVDFSPMGEANYNYYLKHVLLLPLDAAQVEMIGRVELARYRALEALLPDPKLADPDPAAEREHSARSSIVSESLREPRSRDDQLSEGAQPRVTARLSRCISDSAVAGGV